MHTKDLKIEDLTPMMQQYLKIKRQYEDYLLFYRLGDFYELFFEDALEGSKALEIALTKRDCGLEQQSPMCGVPYHVADEYISRLITMGYKVALCEQTEDPKKAKGLVKREVVRTFSPGMNVDSDNLEAKKNNFLASLVQTDYGFGLAFGDISTGELKMTEYFPDYDEGFHMVLNEISRAGAKEILVDTSVDDNLILTMQSDLHALITRKADFDLDVISRAKELGIEIPANLKTKKLAIRALAGLFSYIFRFDTNIVHFQNVCYYEIQAYLTLDRDAVRNLEIFSSLHDASGKYSLLGVIDDTKTAMGGRLLHSYLERPLRDPQLISSRLDLVDAFYSDSELIDGVRALLSEVYDLERILSKISYGRATGKDLIALKLSLIPIPMIKDLLDGRDGALASLHDSLDPMHDIRTLIEDAIVDAPPLTITEGGLIKTGYDASLDELRSASVKGKKLLLEYEQNERERTGIRNLKIVFHKKAGYFIDVTKSNQSKIGDDYKKIQTLTNSDRYVTEELIHIQDMILGSEDQIIALEYEIFGKVRDAILAQLTRLLTCAKIIARMDVASALANIARDYDYVRPEITTDGTLDIEGGRHPVVERTIAADFIPNDLKIGKEDPHIHIITGPNMSGKSTYMRQNALIILLAQIGSFVPAKRAVVPIVDRIFTRIGASDNLSRGESTFMVEMKESAEILKYATKDSFILLDEIGRGTSTYDGLSIARAIVEHLATELHAKTLFSTHYHELTELESEFSDIVNQKVNVIERRDEILFLHKIVPGKSDKSYGIEVARLAGFPDEVLSRAKTILREIEEKPRERESAEKSQHSPSQMDLKDYAKMAFIERMTKIETDEMKPLQALIELDRLVREANKILEESDED